MAIGAWNWLGTGGVWGWWGDLTGLAAPSWLRADLVPCEICSEVFQAASFLDGGEHVCAC